MRRPPKRAKADVISPGWRLGLVLGALSLLPLYLVWHLVQLQASGSQPRGRDFLQRKSEQYAVRKAPIPVHRGTIIDRRGEPLAVSIPTVSLWADPGQLDDAELPRLAVALEMPEAELRRRLKARDGGKFAYLKRHLSPPRAENVLDMGFRGLRRLDEHQRFYPSAEASIGVVGLTDIDDRGQEGLELAYDKWLTGVAGERRILQDRAGRTIAEIERLRPSRAGRDLVTSLDLRIQYATYRELKKAVSAAKAVGGSALVVDIDSAEVLAMVNQPAQNPNKRDALVAEAIANRAAGHRLEPGSTIKPFVIAAALESGQYEADSIIDTSPGYIHVDGKDVHDVRDHGEIALRQVLARSSQVGISKIMLSLEDRALPDLLARFGFASSMRVGLPAEAVGRLPTIKRPLDKISLGYGYGMHTNALELARAYMALANGGRLCPLSLLKRERPPNCERVVTEDIAARTLLMLEGVTAADGTGVGGRVFGYRVGGKTGTVRKYDVERGGYSGEEHLAVFSGVVPVSRPKLAIVIVIDSPRGYFSGGRVAAPVFAKVATPALRLLNVPPDAAPTPHAL